MTLVQVLTDEKSLHMSCDFRLTDTRTKETRSNRAHKLISVWTASGPALIGFTGIAALDNMPTGDWIAESVGPFDMSRSLDDLYSVLRQAEKPLARLRRDYDRRLTFIIGTFVGSQALVTIVSNFERFADGRIARLDYATPDMTVSSIKPKSPVFFATGDIRFISAEKCERLTLALRSGSSDSKIQEQMRQLNELVSDRAEGVSPGCHVRSLHATGSGSGQHFLTEQQSGEFISPESALMLKRFGIRPDPAIGPDGKPMPIQVKNVAMGYSGASPEYFREQLKLRPDSAEVWNNYGAFLIVRRRFADGVSAFEKARALDSSYVTATANLASNVWRHNGDVERADLLYAEAMKTAEPSVPSWIISDFALLCDEGKSDTERAAELHSRAAQDADYPLASARQALFILKTSGDESKSRELLASALRSQPNNSEILYLAGQADFYYFQDNESALQKLHKACSIAQGNERILRLTADVCAISGDPASAAYYYQKVIKRQNNDAEAHGNYGLVLLMIGKVEGALRHLRKARHLNPDNLGFRVNLAAALWVSRNRLEAVSLLKDVIASDAPQEIELEVTAMLYMISPSSRKEIMVDLRRLITAGVRADGNTVRCIISDTPRPDREIGEMIANAIEGTGAIPKEW